MKHGFTVKINITRLILYVGIGMLSYVGEMPWWALPALLLYDNDYQATYHSPKRLRLLKDFYASQFMQDVGEQVKMPGTQLED